MLADIRYALRGLGRSPAFTLVAIVSLALGTGANTAIFGLWNAMALRSLPVPEPARLVTLTMGTDRSKASRWMPYSRFDRLREHNTVLSGLAAQSTVPISLEAGGVSERVLGEIVTGNFFATLGVQAVSGRVLTPDDDRVVGANPVCVIGYG